VIDKGISEDIVKKRAVMLGEKVLKTISLL
jgi:hypothetical protein